MSTSSDSDTSSIASESQASAIDSLQSELKEITKQLQNFSPEKKKNKVGRPAKQKTPASQKSDSLHNLCTLVGRIVTQLDNVLTENKDLKTRLDRIEASDCGQVDDNGTGRGVTVNNSYASITANNSVPVSGAIHQFDTRIDIIDQESLSTTLKLDGSLIKNKIEAYANDTEKDRSKFNQTVIQTVNLVQPGLLVQEDVASINIVGRENKHIKVKLTSHEKKITLLKTFKLLKPTDFYISQYLTRNRSYSLFKLKNLKRNSDKVERVYSYNGSICCKLLNNNKIFHLNNPELIDNFITKHKLND